MGKYVFLFHRYFGKSSVIKTLFILTDCLINSNVLSVVWTTFGSRQHRTKEENMGRTNVNEDLF